MIAENRPPFRVAVTGLGPITAVGTGVENFFAGLRNERSPVRRITRFDASPWRSRLGAEVDDFDAGNYMDAKVARRYDRFAQFAVASARLALEDAQLDYQSVDSDRVAVQMGSALGGMSYA